MDMFEMDNIVTANVTDNSSDFSCAIFQGDVFKCQVVIAVKRMAASLSIVGNVLVISIIVLFRLFKAMTQRLILHLAVASLCTTIGVLINDFEYTSTPICKAQGAILTYAIWECFLWMLLIMFSLYFRVVFNYDLGRFELPLAVVFWIVPVIPTSLGFIFDLYAPAGCWCWMKNDLGWRLGTVYAWKMSSVVIFILAMTHILITMHRKEKMKFDSSASLKTLKQDIKTLRAYPIIYFFMNIFSIIVRIHNAFHSEDEQAGYIYTLLILQNVADPLYGAALAIAYVLDKDTRSKLNWADIQAAIHGCCTDTTSQINEFPLSSTNTPPDMLSD